MEIRGEREKNMRLLILLISLLPDSYDSCSMQNAVNHNVPFHWKYHVNAFMLFAAIML